jgi:hypothetical protein
MTARRCCQAGLHSLLPALMLMSVPISAPGFAMQVANAGAAAARAASASQVKGPAETPAGSVTPQPGASGAAPSAAPAQPASKGPNGLRDPFQPPEPPHRADASAKPEDTGPRPPGIRGLMISQLRLQGVIQETKTRLMIAMVTGGSNLAYFLRENDRLYDGVVSRITPDALYLRQTAPGSSGGAKSGEIVLRLEPGKGESR